MLTALIQMSLLIACGTLWKVFAPTHISSLAHRRALTDLVFYILLPALVLDVIWQAPIAAASLQISFLALCGIVTGLALMWLILHLLKANKQQKGALLLAAAFPNATYLGLPVLDHVIGPDTRAVVLQYDFFACTPILLTFGFLLAQHFGNNKAEFHPLRELIKIPALWAVSAGMTLNLMDVTQHEYIHASLSLLAGGVVPLMLIVLGMSIRWRSLHLHYMGLLLPMAMITLACVPLSVFMMSQIIGLDSETAIIVTLVGAMPTMVFGIVICERYQLDSELYAAAVTLSTVLSLVSLPLWFQWLSS